MDAIIFIALFIGPPLALIVAYMIMSWRQTRSFKSCIMVFLALGIAFVSPIFLSRLIFPAFQVFLPEGNIILTPLLRISATLIMYLIEAVASGVLIYYSGFKNKVFYNIAYFMVLFYWTVLIAYIWYIAVID